MLKIVDCAIAVCAVTTNKSATNNPERTLKVFTVLTRLSSLSAKKKPQLHRLLEVRLGRRRLQNFLPHNSVRRDNFVTDCVWAVNRFFGGENPEGPLKETVFCGAFRL